MLSDRWCGRYVVGWWWSSSRHVAMRIPARAVASSMQQLRAKITAGQPGKEAGTIVDVALPAQIAADGL